MRKSVLIHVLLTILMCCFILSGCSTPLQTYSKHDLSFTVSSGLDLEEYQWNPNIQAFQIGEANSQAGMLATSEGHFVFQWVSTGQKLSDDAIRTAIMSTPDIYKYATVDIEVAFTSEFETETIAGFDVTYSNVKITTSDRNTIGIVALWYCQDSQRTVLTVIVHKDPETEMYRFIRNFTDRPEDQ